MVKSVGFEPVGHHSARVLILGSLPGGRSLAEQRYYAQPRNAFWPIMGRLFNAGLDRKYSDRLQTLSRCRIALWDVIAAAKRDGSLDSAIERDTIEVNDFAEFLSAHRQIELICFNGKTAEQLYRRRVRPFLSVHQDQIPSIALPSTSPAYAAMAFESKLAKWRAALKQYALDVPIRDVSKASAGSDRPVRK